MTETKTGRPIEGEEVWSDDGKDYLGQYHYNPNICTYQWFCLHGKGASHSREEAKESLITTLVHGRLA